MPSPDVDLITCENLDFPGPGRQCVVVDPNTKTVLFECCHCPRGFLSAGYEARRVCTFSDVLATHDFLSGEHRGNWLRTIFTLGQLVDVPDQTKELGSIFISTSHGRCRVFADWRGFPELREAMQQICEPTKAGHWQDDPRWIPVYVIGMLAIVGGLIWWLL